MKAEFTVEEAPALQLDDACSAAVLRIGGEIDSSNAAEFEALVLSRSLSERLVLDLTPVLYCDSAAFAALDRALAKRDVALALGPGNPVRRAALIMGLPLHESVESAARALQG